MYKLLYTRHFKKDFKKLTSLIQEKTIITLKKIKKNPFNGVEKLKGMKYGIYRVRIGSYRIRFDIEKNNLILHSVKHRKEIYGK